MTKLKLKVSSAASPIQKIAADPFFNESKKYPQYIKSEKIQNRRKPKTKNEIAGPPVGWEAVFWIHVGGMT